MERAGVRPDCSEWRCREGRKPAELCRTDVAECERANARPEINCPAQGPSSTLSLNLTECPLSDLAENAAYSSYQRSRFSARIGSTIWKIFLITTEAAELDGNLTPEEFSPRVTPSVHNDLMRTPRSGAYFHIAARVEEFGDFRSLIGSKFEQYQHLKLDLSPSLGCDGPSLGRALAHRRLRCNLPTRQRAPDPSAEIQSWAHDPLL
jgi:hypothetical protein